MRKTLQPIIRRIREAGYRFTAVIKRALRRRRPASRQAVTARIGTHVSLERHEKSAPKSLNSVFRRLMKPFGKRSVRIFAAAGAVVVIAAVVLTVMLSGAAAANAERTGGAVADGSGVNSPQPTGSSTPLSTATPAPTDVPASVPTPSPEVGLTPGCHDPRVIEVQEQLMELGYMGEDEPTDYYGPGTEYALQLFQRKHSLQVDGILGEKTLTALFSGDAKPYSVLLGDKGTDVENIQERLKELRYFSGEVTGKFGDRTETAVKSFQKRNGLSPDGHVGEMTLEALYSEDAKSASTGGSSHSGSGGNSHSGSGGNSSGGSNHGGGSTIADWEPDAAKVEALIEVAQSMLGKKYVKGGKGPNTFDCSGLVYYCLNQSGYSIGYKTSAGWGNCSLPKVTSLSDIRRGDILCFKGHVGIYIGNGQMIDASSTQGKVRIGTTVLSSSYWKRHFICARRLF